LKKFFVVLAAVLTVSGSAFAGGPTSFQDIKEVQKPAEKPKMAMVEYANDEMSKVTKHWTIGLGLGGNPLIAIVEKDGYGYPKCEYGITDVLGYGYTWFSGQPTQKQIKEALGSIKAKNGDVVPAKDLPSMVRQETGITTLNYVQLGTWATILPINAEMGTMWILSDNWRSRLGIGLPTLISFGIAYDF
jgi:hypothetical protein